MIRLNLLDKKPCTKCHKRLPVSCFRVRSDRKNKALSSMCKRCHTVCYADARHEYQQREDIRARRKRYNDNYKKTYYEANKGEMLAYSKEHYLVNKEKRNTQNNARYKQNKVAVLARQMEYKASLSESDKKLRSVKRAIYKKANRRRELERQAFRLKTDPQFKISCNLRRRLNHVLKDGYFTKFASAVADLGCTVDFLKTHLESKFYHNHKTGEVMSWDKYGKYGWHIDHIRPLSSFDLTDPEQQKLACHYTNLQPLWAFENLSKGDSYVPDL